MLAVIAVAAVTAASDKVVPVLNGYDVVEYFSLGPRDHGVKGNANFSGVIKSLVGDTYENYTFYFKNQTNLDLFNSDPWGYAPQWGGY